MKIVEVKHPLVKHKLGLMREHDISTKRFRELASEVGSLLTYEATADLETEKVTIEGWNGPVEVEQIKGKKITVVPILRAGLGMMEGVLEHVPSARISVVGIYRNEETLEPVPYFQKLVSNIDERMALVVDPMLATGGSMIATIDLLKNAGCTSIKVLVLVAAPEGIAALEKAHPDVELYSSTSGWAFSSAAIPSGAATSTSTLMLVQPAFFSRSIVAIIDPPVASIGSTTSAIRSSMLDTSFWK